jgi:nicotinamide-nucleotide amidase
MIDRAAILSTGDELTTGRTLDTNASHIAEQLIGIGIDVTAIIVVGDYPDRIAWAWQEALRQADVVVSTGGLGPTADDLTTEVVSQVAGRRLIMDDQVAQRIRQMFEAMGRRMPENNLKQAMFPEGATIIPNSLGTAPGFRLRWETKHGPRWAVVMPGVPREMKAMLADEALPWLVSMRADKEIYLSHAFQTFGISESALDELVQGAVDPSAGRIAFRAAFPQISVRVTVRGRPGEVERKLENAAAQLRERVKPYCYGEGDTTTMEQVVGQLLRERGATVAVAESCTGGLIGHRLTNVAGSSAYFLGDIVAYSNAVKESLLRVRKETLAAHGAVSEEVAREMALGVRNLAGSTVGVAVTGIAGPEGGTPEKPVGTVCFGLATPERAYGARYQLWGNREWIKLLSSQIALDWIRRSQLGEDPTALVILRK